MARLKVLGPDNAWKRLHQILKWFEEVQAAGGYSKYYDGKSREGTLQGGGTAGGLGLDQEFFESALVPQVILYGFLGFAPRGDGFELDPRLPSDWPELTVDRVRFQNVLLTIRATREFIEIHKQGQPEEQVFLRLPQADWKITSLNEDGSITRKVDTERRAADGALRLDWANLNRPLHEGRSAMNEIGNSFWPGGPRNLATANRSIGAAVGLFGFFLCIGVKIRVVDGRALCHWVTILDNMSGF